MGRTKSNDEITASRLKVVHTRDAPPEILGAAIYLFLESVNTTPSWIATR
jgi:hypothetical protein